MKGYTFYSKSSGLEISVTTATKENRIEGRVRLRLFPLEEGGREKQVVLMLNPLRPSPCTAGSSKRLRRVKTYRTS